MLCVALVAFVLVERISCTDARDASSLVSYNVTQAVSLSTDDGEQREQPAAPLQTQAHHCNCMHAPAIPAAAYSIAIEPTFVSAPVWAPQLNALQNEQGGQDRPPRISAIA